MRRLRDVWWTALTCVGAVLAALSLVDGNAVVALLQAAAPMLAVAGLLLALLLAVRRRAVLAVVALISAAVLVAPVIRLPEPPATPGSRTLSVLSFNTYNGDGDPDALMAEIDARRVDVLVLPEMTDEFWNALVVRGIGERLPHATGRGGGGQGMVVATREPVECVDLPAGMQCGRVLPVPTLDAPHLSAFDQIAVRLPDGTVVRGVHLWSPRLLPISRWHEQQVAMKEWIASRPADEALVLAGDFNAGLPHPIFRDYSAGFEDTPAGDLPWTRTWPVWGPVGPFVQIDHVLSRGWRAREDETVRIEGSDHRAVWSLLTR